MDIDKELLEKTIKTNLSDEHISSYSGLSLAYIGDAVFEILIRTMVIKKFTSTVNKMDKISRSFVKASAQAKMYHLAFKIATPEEQAVLKRGRNAKSYTSAKNASTTDYRHATGLEALFGYLYLKGDIDRLYEIFSSIIEKDNDYV